MEEIEAIEAPSLDFFTITWKTIWQIRTILAKENNTS
jgi:hypothetical protein